MGSKVEVDRLPGEGVLLASEMEGEVLELALGHDFGADYGLVPEDFVEGLLITAPSNFTVLETQFASLL